MTNNSTEAVPEFTLGWRLRRAVEHAGIKKEELADELEISRATLSRWMHDDYRRPIKPVWLKAIALRCGVPYEWLRTGDASQGVTGHYPAGNRLPRAVAA